MSKQIKSKQRVAKFAEVFTNNREVTAMLDMVQDELEKLTSTVLEPACGTGNFLIEVLKRKMDTVHRVYRNRRDYELCSMLVFSTVYGLDIQKDNTIETRNRLFDWFICDYEAVFKEEPSKTLQTALNFILKKNIQCADSLSMVNDKKQPLVIPEWTLCEDGKVLRKDVYYNDLLNGIEHNYIKSYSYKWMKETDFLGGLSSQYA